MQEVEDEGRQRCYEYTSDKYKALDKAMQEFTRDPSELESYYKVQADIGFQGRHEGKGGGNPIA